MQARPASPWVNWGWFKMIRWWFFDDSYINYDELWWLYMIIVLLLWFPVSLYLIVLSYDDKNTLSVFLSVFLHVFARLMKNYNPMLQRYSPGHRNHSSSLGQVGPCWHWMWPLSSRPCAWTSQRKEWVPCRSAASSMFIRGENCQMGQMFQTCDTVPWSFWDKYLTTSDFDQWYNLLDP